LLDSVHFGSQASPFRAGALGGKPYGTARTREPFGYGPHRAEVEAPGIEDGAGITPKAIVIEFSG
jgi:hypothetical protein